MLRRTTAAWGLVARRHRWPQGSQCVAWLCCCSSSCSRSGPGRRKADDASLGSVGFVGGSGLGKRKLHLRCYCLCRFSAGGCAGSGEEVCLEWGLFSSQGSREDGPSLGASPVQNKCSVVWYVVKVGHPQGIEPAWAPFPHLKGDNEPNPCNKDTIMSPGQAGGHPAAATPTYCCHSQCSHPCSCMAVPALAACSCGAPAPSQPAQGLHGPKRLHRGGSHQEAPLISGR